MSLIQFEPAPRTFKKVKTINGVPLSNLIGVLTNHSVPVYMCQAGTPSFVISVCPEYRNAWNNHLSKESQHHGRIHVDTGWLYSATFDGALKDLEALSFNYKRHIESLTIRKVIIIRTVLMAPSVKLYHNKPSFDSSRVMVGVRSEIFWEVNNALYVDDRRGMIWDDAPDINRDIDPTYEQLRPAGRSARGEGTMIPFTATAWKTIQDIEATLERAAVMLNNLTATDTAQALLEGGATGLLGHTP